MPEEDLTELIFIISRVGPMEVVWNDAVVGFNELIDHQRKMPGKALLTLVLFDRDHELLYNGIPLDQVKPLRNAPYTLGGDSAELDAIGRTIQYVMKRLGKSHDGSRHSRLIAVIITEGFDRISLEFTYKQIAKMIRHQEEAHGWKFILATVREDPPGMASAISIDPEDAYHFEPTGVGIRKILKDLDLRIAGLRDGGST